MNKETKLILEALVILLDKNDLDEREREVFFKLGEALNPKTESAELNKERDELMKNKDVEKEMYCAVIDDETGKVCGIVDKTHSAYCSKHGRSTHKMRDITQ